MKKILFAALALLLITGCGEKKENNNQDTKIPDKKEETSELVILDSKTGYTTTFTYPNEKKYSIKKTIDTGKFVNVVFEIPEKNLSFDVYYFESTTSSYDTLMENRKGSKGFKEYKWNSYSGYTYNGDKYSVDFNIFLSKIEDTNNMVGLFGTVEYIDYSKANVLEDFNSEEVQNLLNTVKFKVK